MEQIGSHWTDFHQILYLSIFQKSYDKTQVLLQSNKSNGYLTWRPTNIYDHISLSSSWHVSDKSCRDNQNTHFMLNNLLFENRAVYEIISTNIVQPDRPQMKIWRMLIACGIPKAENRHSVFVILIPFPLQQWLQERASLLSYTYIVLLKNNWKKVYILPINITYFVQ
jgi:hypothetical protein